MKYRTKLVTVEAFKYDGDLMDKDGNYYVPQWAVESYKNGTLFYGCGVGGDELFIEATPESVHRVGVGDCPVCDRTVDSNEHYCFNCGQRLDWEADK